MSNASDGVVEGGCLCRAVRYRVTGRPLAQGLCHCRSCRLASAAPSVAWIVVRSGDFAFISGRPASFRSSPPVLRTFCGRCGTPLTYQHDASPNSIDVTTVSLDFPDRFAPAREVWIEDKVAWETLDATLAHFPRGSGDS